MKDAKPRDKQVLVAPELHYRLKVRAAEEGRPVKAVAEDAIVAYLARFSGRGHDKSGEYSTVVEE